MTKPKQTRINAGGRPLSYDPNFVCEIIEAGLAAGLPAAELDAPYVKEKLCNDHGVKGSIRQEALESLVAAAHAEIVDAENKALLKALPDGIAAAVDEAAAAAGRELLLVLARQHAVSQAVADQTCEELRADKRNAQHRIADLEGCLAEAKEACHTLARERDEMAEELAESQKTLRVAQAEVERLSSEPTGLDHLLAELRDPKNRDGVRAALTEIVASRGTPATQ
ncbi:hypothetical protein SAMN04490244_101198 [Tranquillimonas rosea]|uniref:Replication region DNA-binding N-term n=1 Tax=Tranquillimonas rosea TaxID=641238 RepID=A0A1H9PII1_9RHOB|nr:hypothetical protein [Tranquillimonas rosea]SER47954.1 hypothetical protein SAMN04490244_101198 [Tranquillimonas rosea]